MSLSVTATSIRLDAFAARTLKIAAGAWLAAAVIGQLVFAAGVAVFYTRAVARGDALAWNQFMNHGYMPGHSANNAAAFLHVLMVVVLIAAGALQVTPQVRRRAPSFHRWTGRIYMVAACALSLAGLWMLWVRGAGGTPLHNIGLTLNAILVLVCAAMAWRFALARDFARHRRWALRLFLVATGVWFFRIGVFLSLAIFQGPFGFNPRTFTGPFLDFMSFAAYLLPLAVLELYLRTQDSPTTAKRLAMAACLVVVTIAMTAGSAAVSFGFSLPEIAAAASSRTSIAETLSVTIAASGVDEAIRQYQSIKAAHAGSYNMEESEINTLGYELIHSERLHDAIRVLQLNVMDHAKSANAYDSLAEAYMDAGNKPLAIINYEKSLQLNPANTNAVDALRELNAPNVVIRP